tara:strand:- start:43 stop:297 length:255 start_codon:yes stop_codon:yes gene_type:complete
MPRYSYECHTCNQRFDAVHHHEEVLEECRICKDTNIERIISKVFVYKKTDSKQKTGTKIKETISETIEEMKRYKKQSTEERDVK